MWMTARQIAISSEINTWKCFIAWFAGKGILYMTLVVIVGAYSVCSQSKLKRIEETNVICVRYA